MDILRSGGLVADYSMLVWGEAFFRVSPGLFSEVVFLPFIAVLPGNALTLCK